MDNDRRAALIMLLTKERRRGSLIGSAPRWYEDSGIAVDPRSGESRDQFFRRYSRREGAGGDGSMYDMAARWDRHRSRQSRLRRMFMRRSPRDPGGYVGYEGDHENYFRRTPRGPT